MNWEMKMKGRILFATAMLSMGTLCRAEVSGGSEYFGKTAYGEEATLYSFGFKGGIRLDVTDDGGKVVGLWVPDKEGRLVDVTIGFDDPSGWERSMKSAGAIIGRYANRIAGGRFMLDGKEYSLVVNDVKHGASIHGGVRGWNSHVWQALPFSRKDEVGVTFSRVSPDGEEGFPGTVKVKVTYTVTRAGTWRIDYEATTDKPTPINLTQHVYFNLNGGGSVLDHELQLAADRYLCVDANLKPVADNPVRPVEGTPFDFRTFHTLGERIDAPDPVLRHGNGYDHNWCLNGTGFRRVATLRTSAREVEVWTDQVGLQVYTGNAIQKEWKMKGGKPMLWRGWVALETQHYPDSPNRPEFPSVILRPGETFRSTTEYRFKAR